MVAPAEAFSTKNRPPKPVLLHGTGQTQAPKRPAQEFRTSADPARAAAVLPHSVPIWVHEIPVVKSVEAKTPPPPSVTRGNLTVVVTKELKNAESGHSVATRVADIAEEILSIAGLTGKFPITIILGEGEGRPGSVTIKNNGIRFVGFDIYLDYEAMQLPMADIDAMPEAERTAYLMDYFIRGKYETRMDIGVIAATLAHEIGHLRQFSSNFVSFIALQLLCFVARPLSRYLELQADKFAARALPKLGFVNIPLIHERTHRVLSEWYKIRVGKEKREDQKAPKILFRQRVANLFPKNWRKMIYQTFAWLTNTHPTDQKRLAVVRNASLPTTTAA